MLNHNEGIISGPYTKLVPENTADFAYIHVVQK